jgi:hypothetical protein
MSTNTRHSRDQRSGFKSDHIVDDRIMAVFIAHGSDGEESPPESTYAAVQIYANSLLLAKEWQWYEVEKRYVLAPEWWSNNDK